MDLEKIAPELQPIYRYLPPIPLHRPLVARLATLLIRAGPRSKTLRGVRIRERKIGRVGIRVYTPPGTPSGAGLLWMHGGGFVLGSPRMDDGICSQTARDLKLVVVSIDYRLAPKHPFPAGLEDCLAVWDWLGENGPDLGLDPQRIAIAGQSAGGGLAACLAQRVLDRGGVQPAGQLLIYPMLDERTAADRSLDPAQHPLWNNQNNRGGWTAYLGRPPGAPDLPPYAAASRREDLSGLPPAWIGVGSIDLFYPESKRYAERLERAGVDCDLVTVPGAPHGFNLAAPHTELTRGFQESISRFLQQRLLIGPDDLETWR